MVASIGFSNCFYVIPFAGGGVVLIALLGGFVLFCWVFLENLFNILIRA